MPKATRGGSERDPAAVERVEWLAQCDLGAAGARAEPTDAELGWTGLTFEPPGHWRRYLRDAHPPRFPAPRDVEVSEVSAGDAVPFASAAALWMPMPARTEATFADLPGKAAWRCYVTRGDNVLTASATFTIEDIVLIAIDAAPDNRRKTEHAALLHRVIEDAISSGSRLICARVDERDESRGKAAGLLLAGFEKTYRCPQWVDARLPAG